jgi:hypothetical protein
MMLVYLFIVLFAALLVYAMLFLTPGPTKKATKRGTRGHLDKAEVAGRWNTILLTSETGASGLKSSINEADKLLDHVMKLSGFGGETMADRLRQAERRLSHKNDVWRAHKLRNSLAHDVGFDLVQSQAKEALRDFERALKDLGAI